jgi:polysaccharide biosynthesis protein PslG
MLSRSRTSLLRATLLIAIVAAFTGPILLQPAKAQYQPNDELRMPKYFDETGFWMQGPFREYWETHGGLYIFGYPITGVFLDNGLYKQYFERAIFEYHPEHAGTEYEVLLQRLGAIRTEPRMGDEPFQRLDVEPDANCDVHYPTGHRLCFGFRAYWTNNGGLSNFGYALSEEFDERNEPPPAGDGEVHTVQYFERARFEWHPEYRGTEYEFLLGLLGSEYLARNGAPAEALARQPKDLPPGDPTTGLNQGPHVGYGFNVVWRGDDQSAQFHQQTMDKVNEAGFSWIRVQIGWRNAEPEPGHYRFDHIDRLVDSARANNVRIMASVLKAPTWATGNGTDGLPSDPAAYGEFMRRLAEHFNGRIDAYEIWNEQNLSFETGGVVDVGQYVDILKAGYTGVKTADSAAIVVFGGMTPTGVNDPHIAIDDVNYLREIYAYNGGEVKQYYDVLGTHPGSACNAPDTSWPDNPGCEAGWRDHNSHYFRRAADIRQVMVENGEGHKQIWLTEFGWSSSTNPAPGQEFSGYVSEQQQAEYIVRAFEIAKQEWPWMGIMFLWNLQFSTMMDPNDHKGHWSVLNSDWSHRPAYDAIKAMPK